MKDANSNRFFRKAKSRAANIFKNKQRLNQLLHTAGDKIKKVNVKDIKNSGLVERLGVIARMIRAYAKGDYRNIKLSNILLLLAAVVYFVTPIDLIPDFIPITGLIDDFSVVLWVYSKLQEEIDEYMIWEQSKEGI